MPCTWPECFVPAWGIRGRGLGNLTPDFARALTWKRKGITDVFRVRRRRGPTCMRRAWLAQYQDQGAKQPCAKSKGGVKLACVTHHDVQYSAWSPARPLRGHSCESVSLCLASRDARFKKRAHFECLVPKLICQNKCWRITATGHGAAHCRNSGLSFVIQTHAQGHT